MPSILGLARIGLIPTASRAQIALIPVARIVSTTKMKGHGGCLLWSGLKTTELSNVKSVEFYGRRNKDDVQKKNFQSYHYY